MAETARNGRGRETSMFGLLLPVLAALLLALVLNAFSEMRTPSPEAASPASRASDFREPMAWEAPLLPGGER